GDDAGSRAAELHSSQGEERRLSSTHVGEDAAPEKSEPDQKRATRWQNSREREAPKPAGVGKGKHRRACAARSRDRRHRGVPSPPRELLLLPAQPVVPKDRASVAPPTTRPSPGTRARTPTLYSGGAERSALPRFGGPSSRTPPASIRLSARAGGS